MHSKIKSNNQFILNVILFSALTAILGIVALVLIFRTQSPDDESVSDVERTFQFNCGNELNCDYKADWFESRFNLGAQTFSDSKGRIITLEGKNEVNDNGSIVSTETRIVRIESIQDIASEPQVLYSNTSVDDYFSFETFEIAGDDSLFYHFDTTNGLNRESSTLLKIDGQDNKVILKTDRNKDIYKIQSIENVLYVFSADLSGLEDSSLKRIDNYFIDRFRFDGTLIDSTSLRDINVFKKKVDKTYNQFIISNFKVDNKGNLYFVTTEYDSPTNVVSRFISKVDSSTKMENARFTLKADELFGSKIHLSQTNDLLIQVFTNEYSTKTFNSLVLDSSLNQIKSFTLKGNFYDFSQLANSSIVFFVVNYFKPEVNNNFSEIYYIDLTRDFTGSISSPKQIANLSGITLNDITALNPSTLIFSSNYFPIYNNTINKFSYIPATLIP